MGPDQGHSTLEVDWEAQLANAPEPYTPKDQKDANAPEVPYSELPEALTREHHPPSPAHPVPVICGLRKRTFYIVLGLVLLVAVGAGVGGGVGTSSSSDTSAPSSSSSSSDGSVPSSDGSSSSPHVTLLPTTNLASINYTDEADVEHNLVYYQLSSKAIYQSHWNSADTTWNVSIVANDTDKIMENTPLSADLWRNNATLRNIDVYWLEPGGNIRGLTKHHSQGWIDNGVNGKYRTGKMATYAKECDSCYNNNVVVYQNDHLYWLQTQPTWVQQAIANAPIPASDSDLSLKPVYSSDGAKHMVLHMNSKATGNLTQVIWNGAKWASSQTLPTSISTNASIAAFTAGYEDDVAQDFTIQVLTTDPLEVAGRVTLTAYHISTDKWTSARDVAGFEDILDGSPLAANQAGRVYGLVAGADGVPQIAEWAWSADNASYTRMGNVSIPVPAS